MTLDDTQEQLAGDPIDGLSPRRPRTIRARVAYYGRRRPVLAMLAVVLAWLVMTFLAVAMYEPPADLVMIGFWAFCGLGPAARAALRSGQDPDRAQVRACGTGYDANVPDARRVAELVESTPLPEAGSLRVLRRNVARDLAGSAVIIGLASWALISPRWWAGSDGPIWLLRALAATVLIACVGSGISDVVRSRRAVAAAARAMDDGTEGRYVGRVIGEHGAMPIVLLVDPAATRVALQSDSAVSVALTQDDDVVLDGDLRPDALVAITAGGRTGWVTVNAVG